MPARSLGALPARVRSEAFWHGNRHTLPFQGDQLRPTVKLKNGKKPNLDILPELIGYNLHRAEIASYRSFVRSFNGPKTTPKQFSVLLLIRANPGISQIELGKLLGMDRATTMAVVQRMQEDELLTREPSSVDRRRYELRLTRKGQTLVSRLKKHVREQESLLTSELTSGEELLLRELLIKLRRAMND